VALRAKRTDDRAFRAVRKALLVCSSASPCAIILDLPGLPRLAGKPGTIAKN
jgi:hypothetical protein